MKQVIIISNKRMRRIFFNSIALLACILPSIAYSNVPVANFSVNAVLCAGSSYTITDMSSNVPTAWSYTIDGGFAPFIQPIITSVQNPAVSFLIPGTYTITLVCTNLSGTSAMMRQEVTVLDPPYAFITPPVDTTCAGGLPVTIKIESMPGETYTYNWSTGSTIDSINVAPNVTTTYSCIITGSNGCTQIQTSTVIIGSPLINISSVPVNICPGVTSTLTASGSGPGPKTYTWSNTSVGATTTSSLAGVFTVTMTNGSGCRATKTYNLGTSTTLSLTAISDPPVLCAGDNAQITVTGAATYTWNTGTIADNIIVSPAGNTTFTVRGKIGTCTGTTAITLSVSVNPTISVISTPASICSGESATITATGALSYTIEPGSVVASSLVITPSPGMDYYILGENPGCEPDFQPVNIDVFPAPFLSITSSSSVVCPGQPVALSVSGANSYTWSNGSTASLLLISPLTSGVYSVSGTGAGNCTGMASIQVNVGCTAVKEISANNAFMVYPNPSNGNITVTAQTDVMLNIFDATGREVMSGQLNSANERTLKINDLSRGFYFINLVDGSSVYTKKLIIE